ncbi:DNA translocase FtsK [Bacillus sp. FJAT-49711]|uniref:DNA translocase FtsK n=1 Tax=Bacillus sp. FJAT-49711 TaxID=2833585 RepID=UPI001BCA6349|nr:DNA translocase FtsK [Bacillus sp. FJAT-49711]MBS4216793.1 DNA translocase FtsK [Bacillus sp. FJAT-49711]
MSWLKKILAKITMEESEEEYIPKSNHVFQHTEMDTRMKYQYPKGPFRFPLIEDPPRRNENKSMRTNEDRITKNRTNISELHVRRTKQNPQNVEKDKANQQKAKQKKVESKKIEPINNQPFRATEIPSPIYGFERPGKKEFEYELNDSFLEIQEENNDTKLNDDVLDNSEDTILEDITIEDIKKEDATIEDTTIEDITIVEDNACSDVGNNYEVSAVDSEPVHLVIEQQEDEKEPENSEEHILESEAPRQRSHLPFNVLMLKKDKEKWQQKQLELNKREEMPEPIQMARSETASAIQESNTETGSYHFPAISLLQPPIIKSENRQWLDEQKELLNETLANFNVNAHVVHVSQGPAVTRFEVQPERGVKVSKITNLSDDIKLSMAAKDIRIEAPIPGKRSIGIEIPNQESRPVQISEIIASKGFEQNESPLTAVLGLDISGAPVVTDLRRMPHGLIAGATGSGKSVCINSILISLLYKAKPEELKLLLIDPKMVELAPYNHIPHLVSPVITDVKAATAALKWAVDEMERRYELFSHASVRDISRFNEVAMERGHYSDKLPYIVVVIDELADLMMMAPTDVEESICRIAQKARACGIHLIIATQRPSVDVITGLIKANVPTRIAFSVSSQVDSRTIIDISGAEKLLGRGDMLFLGSGSSKPVRLQGTFVSDHEIDRIVEFVRTQGKPNYMFEQEELLKRAQVQEDEDELFFESCDFVVNQGSASTSLLQRQFRIGYNRAARLILMMEQQGIISEAKGSKPRDVLINERELKVLKDSLV